MMLTLGAGLGLPIEQFKDFAHLALPSSLMAKWEQSWMVPIPDQQVPRIIHDILERYIDNITIALVDMWEHVSMGSPAMEPYQGNTLYDLVASLVHETQDYMTLAHLHDVGSLERIRLEAQVSKTAVTTECRKAVEGSSTAMSWFLGTFYQVYRNKRTSAAKADKYVPAARDGGALLDQVMMLLCEPTRTTAREDDNMVRLQISMQVNNDFYHSNAGDSAHPPPYSEAATREIKRRMDSYLREVPD